MLCHKQSKSAKHWDSFLSHCMSLAEQYGFLDDMDIGGSTDNGAEQTVKQEYQADPSAPLSSKSVNILKFWEVGSSLYDIYLAFGVLMGYFRLMVVLSLLYLLWQWIISPSKPLQCHASTFFLSSAETATKQRNHINPLLMEVLQIRKFQLKKDQLNFFIDGWMMQVN